MSNTFRKDCLTVLHTAGSDLTSGVPVALVAGTTGYMGIPVAAIANTATGPVYTGGTHELAMLSTDTGGAGVVIYWDAGNSRLTTTSSTHLRAGRLAKPKLNGETIGVFELNK